MSKIVVGMLGLMCVAVVGAAVAVTLAAGKLSADLHHSAVALDALVTRLTTVEEDLANISDDVYSMSDDLAAIADSLALDEEDDDGEGGESVGLRSRAPSARIHAAAVRIERVRAREARRARFASVASHRPARTAHSAADVTTAH
ncbi:MAG: hypothetical protein U0842_04130 [Candidatus Binatia bacterium]